MSLKRVSTQNLNSTSFPRRLGVLAGIELAEGFENWTTSGGIGSWTAIGSTGPGTFWGGQTGYVTQGSMGGVIANEYASSYPSAYDTYLVKTFNLRNYSQLIVDLNISNANNGGYSYVSVGGTIVWQQATIGTYANTTIDISAYGTTTVAFGAYIAASGSVTRLARLNFDNLRLQV